MRTPIHNCRSQKATSIARDRLAATMVIPDQAADSPGTPHRASAEARKPSTTAATSTSATGRRVGSGSSQDRASVNGYLGSDAAGAR